MPKAKKKRRSTAGSNKQVRVYFATNRNPNRKLNPDGFTGDFNRNSVDSLRFGVATCDVSGRDPEIAAIEVAPEKLGRGAGNDLLGSQRTFSELRHCMQGGKDTLVLLHAFNVSFADALKAGASILRNYSHKLNVVVFSWPSDGSLLPYLAYKRDRTDAAASAPAFARALLKLRDFMGTVGRGDECGARLHLMTHSMGAYVLRHGIQEAARHGEIPRLFDQVFLMAADEDDDAFSHEYKLRPLPRLGNSINVYFNRGDTALVISDLTKSNPTRLGSQGPREPLNVPANVTNIDVSEIVTGLVEHSYHINDKRVVADIEHVLAGTAHDQVPGRRYVASQNRYVLTG